MSSTRKTLLIAGLITLLFTLLLVDDGFGIRGPIGLGGLAVILILPVLIFFGSILLIRLFNFFREIKKLKWFWLGVFTIIATGFLSNDCIRLYIEIYFRNRFYITEIPNKYAKYKNYDSIAISNNSISELEKFGDKYFISPKNELIVLKTIFPKNKQGKHYLYKYNHQGNLFSTLTIDVEDKQKYSNFITDKTEILVLSKSNNCNKIQINYHYFHKEKRLNINCSEYWQGKLYFDIITPKMDTLKFYNRLLLKNKADIEKKLSKISIEDFYTFRRSSFNDEIMINYNRLYVNTYCDEELNYLLLKGIDKKVYFIKTTNEY